MTGVEEVIREIMYHSRAKRQIVRNVSSVDIVFVTDDPASVEDTLDNIKQQVCSLPSIHVYFSC